MPMPSTISFRFFTKSMKRYVRPRRQFALERLRLSSFVIHSFPWLRAESMTPKPSHSKWMTVSRDCFLLLNIF
jgi:hypothetical protein